MKWVDNFYEKTTKLIGSTPVILVSTSWCVYAYIKGNREFIDIVSMVTYVLGLLILRGQGVAEERMEEYTKKDLKTTRKVKSMLE